MSLVTRDQQLALRGNFEKDGKLYLVNCYACGRENYALMVASGKCAWCGWCQDDVETVSE
jgi:hypothetical protein